MKKENVLIRIKGNKEIAVERKNIAMFKLNEDEAEMKYKKGVVEIKNVLLDFNIKETKELNKDNFYKKIKISDVEAFVYVDDLGNKIKIMVKDNKRRILVFDKKTICMRFIED